MKTISKKTALNGAVEAHNEAMRYVYNAKDILKTKAGKNDNFYTDKKYVRMAGNTLWNGVLEAMDYRFPEIKKRTKTRVSVNDYKEIIAKTDKKILTYFITTYEEAHLSVCVYGKPNFVGLVRWENWVYYIRCYASCLSEQQIKIINNN